jgi:hypothetical protein
MKEILTTVWEASASSVLEVVKPVAYFITGLYVVLFIFVFWIFYTIIRGSK